MTAGKVADLLVLSANPLADIRNTQRIEAVVFNGALYDRDALDQIVEHVQRQARSWSVACKILWRFVRNPVAYSALDEKRFVTMVLPAVPAVVHGGGSGSRRGFWFATRVLVRDEGAGSRRGADALIRRVCRLDGGRASAADVRQSHRRRALE